MNRRTSLITIFGLGVLGTSTFSIFKWVNNPVELESIYSQKSLIAELAETIIPSTDTPGAKDAKVEEFIIKIIVECTDQKSQSEFLAGLKDIQNYSIRYHGDIFQKCNLKDRIKIMKHFENRSFTFGRIINKIKNKLLGESFFSQLKRLTIIGFCTSELGATQTLIYDYIPVNYEACIPLTRGQNSWATN